MITAGSRPDGQLASCAVQRQVAQQARLDDLQREGVIALADEGGGGGGELLVPASGQQVEGGGVLGAGR